MTLPPRPPRFQDNNLWGIKFLKTHRAFAFGMNQVGRSPKTQSDGALEPGGGSNKKSPSRFDSSGLQPAVFVSCKTIIPEYRPSSRSASLLRSRVGPSPSSFYTRTIRLSHPSRSFRFAPSPSSLLKGRGNTRSSLLNSVCPSPTALSAPKKHPPLNRQARDEQRRLVRITSPTAHPMPCDGCPRTRTYNAASM